MRFVLCLTILTIVVPASAERRSHPAPDTSVVLSDFAIPKPQLRHIIRDSGKIFAGTVIKVERASSGIATTQITFRVEEAIRGVRQDQILQVQEWGGLWQTGERYQVGEHVLLFLYRPSKLGLTSPVGGTAGRLQIDRDRRVGVKTGSPAGVEQLSPLPLRHLVSVDSC